MRTIPSKLLSSEKREYTGEYSSQNTREFTSILGTDCSWASTKTGKYIHDSDSGHGSETTVYVHHYFLYKI